MSVEHPDQQILGGAGVIEVAGLLVTITPLTWREELQLQRRLLQKAEEYYGDPYKRVAPMLAHMAPADRQVAVQELVRLAVKKEPLAPEAIAAYRSTNPEWVAEETYLRGKKATQGLTLEGLKAVINEVNAPEVFEQLWRVITGGTSDPKETPTSLQSNLPS